MSLKNKFLRYVELQRSANDIRMTHGIDDPKTVDAYMKANEAKRNVLKMIEELEGEE